MKRKLLYICFSVFLVITVTRVLGQVNIHTHQLFNNGSITGAPAPAQSPAKKDDAKPSAPESITSVGYIKVIEIDKDLDVAKEPLPFDRAFILLIHAKDSNTIQKVFYKRIPTRKQNTFYKTPQSFEEELSFKLIGKDAYVYVPPLQPNSFYDFLVYFDNPIGNTIDPSDPYHEKYYQIFEKIQAGNFTEASRITEEINTAKLAQEDPYTFELTDVVICQLAKSQKPAECSSCDCSVLTNNVSQHIIQLKKFYDTYLADAFKESDLKKRKQKVFDIIKENKPITLSLSDYGVNCCNYSFENHVFRKGYFYSALTHIYSFETRTRYSVNLDFGAIGYYGNDGFWGITPYMGIHVELRYFDKDVPFRLVPKSSPRFLHLSHWSLAAGITQGSLAKDGVRTDFFKKTSFFTGVGYRLTNALRLNFGALWYNKLDPNPLLDKKRLAAVPYFGLSIDLQVRKLIQNLGFGPKLENLDSVIPVNKR